MHITPDVLALSQTIWQYHHLGHSLQAADCILVLGSHDTRVAQRGAQLWLEGYAPLLIFSGGLGRLTEGMWTETEADKFAQIALEMGVPPQHILTENRSTNTGENIAMTYHLLQKHGIAVKRIILVQKPYMERRAYATFQKQWPGEPIEVIVTSPPLSLEEYPTEDISLEAVIHIMMGDLQRIHVYPQSGFQIYQEIPDDVWAAYHQLKEKGFTHHLIPDH